MEREKRGNLGETPEQTTADQIAQPAPKPPPGILHCPQCGSARIRHRTRPLLLNAAACVVCVPLTILSCAMVVGVLLSLLALPITVCIATVGRRRCLDCRHRFEPERKGDAKALIRRFPWLFHVGNYSLLLLLCIVFPKIMRIAAGAGRLPDMMMDVGLIMSLGLLLWASLAYHLVLYRLLKRRVASLLFWAVLFPLPGVLGGGTLCYWSRPSVHIRALLRFAELAPLPQSATDIKIYSWSTPFSGEDFLRFTAGANDIDQFLADSRALEGQEPERFSAERMRLRHTQDSMTTLTYLDDGHEHFIPDPTAPSWYKQEIRGPARSYHIQPPRYQYPGEVLVDDETQTVYIYLCFS